MTLHPRIGVPLPRAQDAAGIREKLATYSLDEAHATGGPKARRFEQILGIRIEQIDHLEASIRSGILTAPVRAVRANSPYGVTCIVEIEVEGLGSRHHLSINVRTVWAIAEPGAAPRLITAYPRP
jgi:hypothetical protein